MLLRINRGLHIATFLLVAGCYRYGVEDLLVLSVSLAISWTTGHVGLAKARLNRNNGLGVVTIGLVVFFLIAYTAKLGLAVFYASEYWVVPRLITETDLLSILPRTYLLAATAYAALVFTVLAAPFQHQLDWRILDFKPRITLLLTIVLIGLIVKYFLKMKFSLGVPGVEPLSMGVPYLGGVLTLVLEFGFVFLVNLPIFFAFYSGSRALLGIGLVLAFGNSGIDLSFGSKDTLMYELAIIGMYMSIFGRGLTSNRRRFEKTSWIMILVLAVVGTATLTIYKYLNFIRFALLYEMVDIKKAIAIAAQSQMAQDRSSIIELYNRITGLETLAAVMHLRDGFSGHMSLWSMINGSVVRFFTENTLGLTESKVAFAMTEFGYFYVVGGTFAVIAGSILLGGLFSAVQFFVVRYLPVHHNIKLAFLPVLWIIFVFVLLGGGNLILWTKSVVVTLAFVQLIGSLSVRRTRRS